MFSIMPKDRKMLTILCLFLIINIFDGNCDLLKLQNGLINGTVGHTGTGRLFKQFYGIPYAEPPIAELRFKAPVPVKPWSGIKDASKPQSKCVQPKSFIDLNSDIGGSEDCLYLNVFVPNDLFNARGKSPVIVGIHGGAFNFGEGMDYTPDYFMEKDIIFVNFNYRLGVLGFFGMNNDVISGNFGTKDQSLALRWVHENIARFGGDPGNVTLLGESSGASSIHLHMFSPLSKGLFQKAIIQSGSAFAPWSHHDEGQGEAISTAFLVISGCIRAHPAKILKCLQHIPYKEFNTLGNKLYMWQNEPGLLFKPMIESKVKIDPFLPQKPTNSSYRTNVPWITGINANEGAFKVMHYIKNDAVPLIKIINSDKKRILPLINDYVYVAEPGNVDNTTQKIIDFYFGTKEIGYDTAPKLVDMITDSTFLYPMIKTIQSNHHRQYVYLYEHRGFSFQNFYNITMDLGVGHADELPLLFRMKHVEAKLTPQDKKVSENLLKFWINFAISADPNGNADEKLWKPVQTSDIEYLHIKSNSLIMKKKFLKERFDFWESLSLWRKHD